MNRRTDAMSMDDLLGEMTWVRSLALALARDAQTAEELVQETWVKLLEKHRTDVVQPATARAWIRVTMRGVLRHGWRSERRRRTREERVARVEKLPSTYDVVAACAVRQEVAETVMTLEEPYRTTLLFRYFEDMEVDAIARQMEVTREAVRQRLVRGRARVRAALEREGHAPGLPALLALFPRAETPVAQSTSGSLSPDVWAGVASAAGLLAVIVALRSNAAELPAATAPLPPTPPPIEEDAPQVSYRTGPSGDGPVLDDRGRPLWNLTERRAPHEPRELPSQPVSLASVGLSGDFGRVEARPDVRETLASALGRAFQELESIELGDAVVERAASETDAPPERLRQVEFWRAAFEDADGTRVDGMIARAELRGPFEGASLVVLFDAERVDWLVAIGSPELERDPDFRWDAFLRQMRSASRAAPRASERTPDREALARFEEWQSADSEDGALARSIQRQLLAMRANRQFGTAGSLLEESGRPVPLEWARELQDRMARLANDSATFDPVLGPDAQPEHAARAANIAQLYGALAQVPHDDTAGFQSTRAALRRVCGECHRDYAPEPSASVMGAFDEWHDLLELPRGVLRVGVDLAPALGDDGVRSAELAQAFRGMVALWRNQR